MMLFNHVLSQDDDGLGIVLLEFRIVDDDVGSLLDGIGCQRVRQDGGLDIFTGQDGFRAQGQVRHLNGVDFGGRNPQFLFILVHQIVHHGIF